MGGPQAKENRPVNLPVGPSAAAPSSGPGGPGGEELSGPEGGREGTNQGSCSQGSSFPVCAALHCGPCVEGPHFPEGSGGSPASVEWVRGAWDRSASRRGLPGGPSHLREPEL